MSVAALFGPFLATPGAHVLAFVLGTLFGSFANVCIYRWPPSEEHPRGRSVVRPGSHCSSCGQPVKWYDNIPIVSYFILRGRCRGCDVAFSPRYVLVEGLTGLLFVAAYHHVVLLAHPGELVELRLLRFVITAAFLLVLVIIAFIDLDHKLILDKVTYPAIPIFYGLGLLLPERSYVDGLVGAAVGYGLIYAVSRAYELLAGRPGLGLGDGKLLAMVGALWTWKAVIVALFAGSLVGSVVSVSAILVARRHHRQGASQAGPPDGAGDGAADDALESESPDSAAAAGGRSDIADTDGASDLGVDLSGAGSPPDAVSLRHVEVPFGPFLAVGVVFYILSETWLEIAFAAYPPV